MFSLYQFSFSRVPLTKIGLMAILCFSYQNIVCNFVYLIGTCLPNKRYNLVKVNSAVSL